jgi:YbgC/YbaW family acyl-CoA thioester hydrolase
MALPYEDTLHGLGGDLFVRRATLEYEASARYDDRLDIGLRCDRIGRSSIALRGAVFRGAQRLVVGELVYVFADPATQTSKPVPTSLRDWFEAFEAAAPMLTIESGDWTTLGAAARPLRDAVFGDELGLGAGFGEDAGDAAAVHVVARNRLGRPVGTGRLQPAAVSGTGAARLARIAVLPALRGGGCGGALVEALVTVAHGAGATEVELDAQADAVGFYRRHGFEPVGEPFEHGSLPHRTMRRRLTR